MPARSLPEMSFQFLSGDPQRASEWTGQAFRLPLLKPMRAKSLPELLGELRATLFKGIVTEAPTHLSDLPPKFQNAFESAKARAELEYATRAERFPYHSDLADSI